MNMFGYKHCSTYVESDSGVAAGEKTGLTPVSTAVMFDLALFIPSFLTIIVMPLAYSISDGLVFGIVFYAVMKLFVGKS